MAVTISPKVTATPACDTAPPVSLSMTMAPVPQNTKAKLPIISAMERLSMFYRYRLFGIYSDTVDPRTRGFKGGNLPGIKVLTQYIIRNSYHLFLLKNGPGKPGGPDHP